MELKRMEDVTHHQHSSLLKALFAARVVPFDPDSVRAYKEAQCSAAPKASFWYQHIVRVRKILDLSESVFLAITILSVLGLLGTVAGMLIEIAFGSLGMWWQTALVSCGFLVVLSICMRFLLNKMRLSNRIVLRGPAYWSRAPLQAWHVQNPRALPKEAQALVTHIREASPGTKLYIDELRQDAKILDPFIVAVCAETDDELYILQWNEDDFTA